MGTPLSSREQEALDWMLLGYDRNEVAAAMNFSPYTARGYACKVLAKTGAANQVKLIIIFQEKRERATQSLFLRFVLALLNAPNS